MLAYLKKGNTSVIIGLILFFIFLWLVIPPLLSLIINSITVHENFNSSYYSFKNYKDVFAGEFVKIGLNTLVFAVGSSLISILIGGAEAWIYEKTNISLKGLLMFTSLLSMAVPYVLYTFSWVLILGNNGPVNAVISYLLGIRHSWIHVDNMFVMCIIEGILWSPMVFLLIVSILKNIDTRLEEASFMSGASNLTTIRKIDFPLLFPGLMSVTVLIFIRSLQAFEVPAVVGLPNNIQVISTDIYLNMVGSSVPQYGLASAISVFLLFVACICYYLYYKSLRYSNKYKIVTGKGLKTKKLEVGYISKIILNLIVLIDFVLKLFIPIGWLIWTSLLKSYSLPSFHSFHLVTLNNYLTALVYPEFTSATIHSLLLAIMGATIIILFSSLTSWIIECSNLRGRRILDYLSSMPLVFPAIVLGVGILELYINLPITIYGTIWILLIGYMTMFLPYGMRYIHPSIIQLGNELDEAAKVCGATPFQSFRSIILPLLRPSILSSWLFSFLLIGRELTLSVFLASPGSIVAPVELFDLWNNGQMGQAAAFGIIWTIMMAIVLFIFLYITKKRELKYYL